MNILHSEEIALKISEIDTATSLGGIMHRLLLFSMVKSRNVKGRKSGFCYIADVGNLQTEGHMHPLPH